MESIDTHSKLMKMIKPLEGMSRYSMLEQIAAGYNYDMKDAQSRLSRVYRFEKQHADPKLAEYRAYSLVVMDIIYCRGFDKNRDFLSLF